MDNEPTFPDGSSNWTRIGLAADWLSDRMKSGSSRNRPANLLRDPAGQDDVTFTGVVTHLRERDFVSDDAPTPDPAELRRCNKACDRGGKAMERYCLSLPNARLRAACWVAAKAGDVACRNWCYWHYGD